MPILWSRHAPAHGPHPLPHENAVLRPAWVCVDVYVCVCVCVYVCMCVCVYVYVCVCVYIYDLCMCICTSPCMGIYTHACVGVSVCVSFLPVSPSPHTHT